MSGSYISFRVILGDMLHAEMDSHSPFQLAEEVLN